jgi:hypothetical protein
VLALEIEVPMAGTAGDNDRFSLHLLTIDCEFEWLRVEIDCFYGAELNPGAKPFSLFLHPHHQLISIDPFGETRVILNYRGRSQQAPGLPPCENQRPQVRSRGV